MPLSRARTVPGMAREYHVDLVRRTLTVERPDGTATTVPMPDSMLRTATNITSVRFLLDRDRLVVGLPGGVHATVELLAPTQRRAGYWRDGKWCTSTRTNGWRWPRGGTAMAG